MFTMCIVRCTRVYFIKVLGFSVICVVGNGSSVLYVVSYTAHNTGNVKMI
jgi:hypothetical protein